MGRGRIDGSRFLLELAVGCRRALGALGPLGPLGSLGPRAAPRPPGPPSPLRGEKGQATVETALSLILAFSLAFLLFEASMLAYSYSVLNDAAREGVRYAIVHGADSGNCSGPSAGCGDATGANVAAVVESYAAASFHDVSAANMTVTVAYPDATQSKPASLVAVTVSYKFVPYFAFSALGGTLTVTSQGRILY